MLSPLALIDENATRESCAGITTGHPDWKFLMIDTKINPSTSRGPIRKALRWGWTVLLGYGGFLVLLLFLERSMLYPMPDVRLGHWEPTHFAYDVVRMETPDGTRLHGWYLRHDDPRGYVVHFHGNGEDVSTCGEYFARWRDSLKVNILVMDYRGYGHSEGKPVEANLVADGVGICKWLAEHEKIDVSEIVLWGRSIGGGVAAGVAPQIRPRGIIMECTFDSLANVAASHFRWAPVGLLMRNKFPSAQRLKDYNGKYLQWHGTADNIVPIEFGERLFEAVGSESGGTVDKEWIRASGRGHNDEGPSQFADAIRVMFKSFEKSDALASIRRD